MSEHATERRRGGGHTVVMRVVLDHPPDLEVLTRVAGALRSSDDVVLCPGFEIEVMLVETDPVAVVDSVLPRIQRSLDAHTIRQVQIDGEDVLVGDD